MLISRLFLNLQIRGIILSLWMGKQHITINEAENRKLERYSWGQAASLKQDGWCFQLMSFHQNSLFLQRLPNLLAVASEVFFFQISKFSWSACFLINFADWLKLLNVLNVWMCWLKELFWFLNDYWIFPNIVSNGKHWTSLTAGTTWRGQCCCEGLFWSTTWWLCTIALGPAILEWDGLRQQIKNRPIDNC